MSPRSVLRRKCIVTALELIPAEGGVVPLDLRMRQALDVVGKVLEIELHKDLHRPVLVTGQRVAIITPIAPNDTSLFFEFVDVAVLQAELCRRDFLLRGAVTIGYVETRTDFTWGDGLTNAERLRDLSDVSRVIVDPLALVELESDANLRAKHHSVADELGYIRQALRQDGDGIWFIDYLATYIRETSQPLPILQDHLELLMRRLAPTSRIGREARALTWLWHYHNAVIDQLLGKGRLEPASADALRCPPLGTLAYAFPTGTKSPG